MTDDQPVSAAPVDPEDTSDLAREIAVALERQVAAVRALMEHRAKWGFDTAQLSQLRAALAPDPADRGTGRGGGEA